MKRKTLLLINPTSRLRPGFNVNRATRNQPLSLGIIAALTPPDWKIKLIDENFREFHYYEADLVGLTSFTSTAPRAYEIAAVYRARGIPVIMGGIHASMLPDEALEYVDTVVQGEAEGIWPEVIRDFEQGTLKRRYISPTGEVIRQPKPRRDLFHPGYVCAAIQTTRGCPMNCSFCSVSAFNGRQYRFRPIDDVLDELQEIPQKFVFFIDDNITGHNDTSRERAKELFRGILKRGIKKIWLSQASIHFADDPELLRLAYRSGCRMIFLGIESETAVQLEEANKRLNLSRGVSSYEKVFRTIQRHGIGVIAGLIFGWDSDTVESIRNRAVFARRCGADSFQTSVLTPLPGTSLFEKIRMEGRLLYSRFPADWQRYDFFEPTIRHPRFSAEELDDEIERAKQNIYRPRVILHKNLKTFLRTRDLMAGWILSLNYWHYRNIMIFGKLKP
jgi:radical SAM superfamily enzyme YgiQ (UPF0313 family)